MSAGPASATALRPAANPDRWFGRFSVACAICCAALFVLVQKKHLEAAAADLLRGDFNNVPITGDLTVQPRDPLTVTAANPAGPPIVVVWPSRRTGAPSQPSSRSV